MFHRIGVSLLVLLGALAPTAGLAARHNTARPAFPVTIKAANGTVTIKARPVRIISLAPTITEDLYAVGAGKQVVAVDKDSDYPTNAAHSNLDAYTPNAEAVAAYNPDLVLISNDMSNIKAHLQALGITVLQEPAANTFEQAYSEIEQVGRATGHARRAARLVKSMKTQIAALVRSVPRKTRKLSVFHELSPDLYTATSKTFAGRVYALFGLHNIADAADSTGSGYPQLSAEYVISANPDLIVLADHVCCGQSAKTVAARPGWSNITAVKDSRVIVVNDDIASRWGPRLVNFVRIIARALKKS